MIQILTTAILFLFAYNSSFANDFPKLEAARLKTQIDLIVIDPGYGGKESGPSGFYGNVQAKNINLDIAKKLSEKIKDDLSIKAILTRESDSNVPLEQRTAVANMKGADLLISIHTNGFENPSVSGIETYCLNLVPDKIAVGISAMTNSKNQQDEMQLAAILEDLMNNRIVQESELLATNVHNFLCSHLKQKYKNIRDRGIKQAPFYILVGATMPAIILQTGFITNPSECELLRSEEYQKDIVIGIVEGIKAFIEERGTQSANSPDRNGIPAD